jgi:hypothetical protein
MIPVVDLNKCHFKAHCGKLTLPSEYVGMPSALRIRSHHTGRTVLFRPVGPGHALYDEDGYDGEQMVYEPMDPVNNVKVLVIYNQY